MSDEFRILCGAIKIALRTHPQHDLAFSSQRIVGPYHTLTCRTCDRLVVVDSVSAAAEKV